MKKLIAPLLILTVQATTLAACSGTKSLPPEVPVGGGTTAVAPAPVHDARIGSGQAVPGKPASEGANPASLQGVSPQTFQSEDRAYVRTGNASLVAADPVGVADAISALAIRLGGRVTNRQDTRGFSPGPEHKYLPGGVPTPDDGPASKGISPRPPYFTPTSTVSVRVPEDKFDTFTASIRSLTNVQVDNLAFSTSDVTDALVDLDARIKAKRATEDRYLILLTQAKTFDEVLRVSQALENVRSQLEQLDAQKTRLRDQTTYSTVNVSIRQPSNVSTVPETTYDPRTTFLNALGLMRTFGESVLNLAIYLLVLGGPLLLILGLVLVVRRRRN